MRYIENDDDVLALMDDDFKAAQDWEHETIADELAAAWRERWPEKAAAFEAAEQAWWEQELHEAHALGNEPF